MKKILLATTVLAMSATVAAAEVSLSGSAAMGVGRDGVGGGDHASNDGNFHAYSTASVTMTMSGETDGGLSFGAGFAVATGTSYAFADDDGFNAEGLASSSEVFLSGGFGKLSMKVDTAGVGQYKAYQTDDGKGYDVQYTNTIGGLSLGLRADIDNDAADGDYSMSLGYTQDAISASLAYDASGAWGASASYSMGAVTGTIGTDDASVSYVKVAYAADGMSASLKANNNSDWDLALGYAAGGVSVDVAIDESNVWSASAGYDLGGGAAIAAGINSQDDAFAGVTFSF